MTWKAVVIYGLLIGAVLAIMAYMLLGYYDEQIKAEMDSRSLEKQHQQWVQYMKEIGGLPDSNK